MFATDKLATKFVVCDRPRLRRNWYICFDAVDIDNVRDTIVFQGYVPLFVIFSGYKNPENQIIIELYGGANLSISWFVLRHPNTTM